MRTTCTAIFLSILAACNTPAREGSAESRLGPRPPQEPPPRPALPVGAGAFAPSLAASVGDPGLSRNIARESARVDEMSSALALDDVEQCGSCHGDVIAMWQSSAHAFASFNNPIYRLSVERLRDERGGRQSRWCGGCHDIALLFDGALDAKVVAPTDRRAHAGVTCRTCHGIVDTRVDGDGSYTLRLDPIPIPRENDPDSVKAHVAAVAPKPLRTASLCTSCHRVFLDEASGNEHHLFGQDDATPWSASVFSGNQARMLDEEEVAPKDCRGCHMPLEEAVNGDAAATDGKIASHRFLGTHTWLAAMRGDHAALLRNQEFLAGVASIDVGAVVHPDGSRTLPADGAIVTPGSRVLLDVVVRNRAVGHRFPGGILDSANTWIEVAVHDASGRLVASDDGSHVLRAELLDGQGKPVRVRQTHTFRAVVWNHTVLPRDATAVQYALDVPEAVDLPLRVTARLRHRTRNDELAAAACVEHRSPRGRQYAAFATKYIEERGGPDLASPVGGEARVTSLPSIDACAPQPITEIAESEVWIGDGSAGRPASARPRWLRMYEHGLALSHALQERLDEARPGLDGALAELDRIGGTPREKAAVLATLANVAGRQGRTDEAMALLDRAEALMPGHPAIAHARGEALSAVWRWSLSIAPLQAAADAAPNDPMLWMHLAVAAGSAGDPWTAIEAAQKGLALQPRDPDMLRVQALALAALGDPDGADRSMEAYLVRRPADDAPGIRARCSKLIDGCARERNPVHVHELIPGGVTGK